MLKRAQPPDGTGMTGGAASDEALVLCGPALSGRGSRGSRRDRNATMARSRVSAGRSPIALDHRIQDTSGNFSLLREKDQKDAIALLEGESFAPSLPTEHLN